MLLVFYIDAPTPHILTSIQNSSLWCNDNYLNAIAASYPVTILHIQPNEFTFGCSQNRGIAQEKSGIRHITVL